MKPPEKKEWTSVWTAGLEGGSLIPESVEASLYDYFVTGAVSSGTPLTFKTSLTSGSYSTSSKPIVFGPHTKTYTLSRNLEIGDEEMKQLVDKLVKERYPAYVPRR